MVDKKGLEKAVDDLSDEHQVQELSELGEVMNSLDNDKIGKDKLSNVDFNTRLNDMEISSIMIIDELANIGLFPADDTGITRRKKRLSVSKDGLGREEKVRIVQGQRDQQSGQGFMGKLGGLFQKRE